MMGDSMQIMVVMIAYMLVVIGIGVAFARRANQSSEDYFLGGRTLGPWVTAMSAEASDMSGWLLMGLPGVAYWCGISDAAWTAIGLAAGTYINWLITSACAGTVRRPMPSPCRSFSPTGSTSRARSS